MKTCLVTIVACFFIAFVLLNWSRRKKRTYDEFHPLLRKVDLAEARLLFDRSEEDRLESTCNPLEFRQKQRARLEMAIELVGRALHDNRLAREWNNTEWRDMIDQHLEYELPMTEAMKTLRRETWVFMLLAMVDLSYMWFLSLLHFDKLRFMPVPSIAALRKVGSRDIVQAYERVVQATANLARMGYSEEEAEVVLAKM